jgi:hypothetical protein
MMSENIARNMLSSQGTINHPTQLHFVGRLFKNCIMMHGTMNVNYMKECDAIVSRHWMIQTSAS